MPFAQKLGQAFEDAMETAFKESETRHQPQVAHLVNLWLHRRGALLQLDGNEELESLLTRKGGGKVPDYIYVTRDTIFPLELKANMRCAKPKQIYASNLRKVFQKTERVISKVFDGLTVEGRFIQKPKEEKKRKKAEKDDTPMKALSDLGVNGHDIGKVAQLWAKCVKKKKPEPITQHDLHVWGVCKTDLGLIVTIFNDKLQQVR